MLHILSQHFVAYERRVYQKWKQRNIKSNVSISNKLSSYRACDMKHCCMYRTSKFTQSRLREDLVSSVQTEGHCVGILRYLFRSECKCKIVSTFALF